MRAELNCVWVPWLHPVLTLGEGFKLVLFHLGNFGVSPARTHQEQAILVFQDQVQLMKQLKIVFCSILAQLGLTSDFQNF